MKRRIVAAENDYVKIGNMILPRDAREFGYQSPEQISKETTRRYNAEKQAEADAREKARLQEEAKDKVAQIESLKQTVDPEYPLNAYFEVLVPGTGKADTLAGELVRAMMRLQYRDWNDGDIFYTGYGLETCAPAAAFLIQNLPDEIGDILIKAADAAYYDHDRREQLYTQALAKCAEQLMEYIDTHPELIATPNTKDMFDTDISAIQEMAPTYDLDCSLPDNVLAHLEAGNISYRDIQWELESWDNLRGADIAVNRDGIYVYELSEEDYEELEENLYTWLESWGDDLDSEYGIPGEEDEDDYDEYEEGEEEEE